MCVCAQHTVLCLCVCAYTRVRQLILGVLPGAAYSQQSEESSPDQTPAQCQTGRTTGSPSTYAAATPQLSLTHTHTLEYTHKR